MPDWLHNLLADHMVRPWIDALGCAAGVALLFQLFGALSSSPNARANATALAVAIGFGAAFYVALADAPPLPPVEWWQWSLWLTLASLLLLFVEEPKAAAATLRFVLQTALVGGLAWFMFARSSRAREWPTHEFRIALASGGVGAVLLLVLTEIRSLHVPAWRTLFSATIAAAGTSGSLLHHFEKGARLEAALAAALGVSALLAALRRDATIGKTATSTLAIAVGSLVLFGWSAQYLDGRAAIALVVATFVGLLPLPNARPWTSAIVTLLVAGGLAGAAYYWSTPAT